MGKKKAYKGFFYPKNLLAQFLAKLVVSKSFAHRPLLMHSLKNRGFLSSSVAEKLLPPQLDFLGMNCMLKR